MWTKNDKSKTVRWMLLRLDESLNLTALTQFENWQFKKQHVLAAFDATRTVYCVLHKTVRYPMKTGKKDRLIMTEIMTFRDWCVSCSFCWNGTTASYLHCTCLAERTVKVCRVKVGSLSDSEGLILWCDTFLLTLELASYLYCIRSWKNCKSLQNKSWQSQ